MLFLPLMLPTIISKSIQFLKFNKFPIFLVLTALGMRTIGDFLFFDSDPLESSGLEYVFGLSGWLIVLALFIFVIMIHRAMKSMSSDLHNL